MAYQKRAYVEHVAIWVKDIHWHIRFFREVLGVTPQTAEVDACKTEHLLSMETTQKMARFAETQRKKKA